MPKNSWTRQPPILRLFVFLEETKLLTKRDAINAQLARAKVLLETQLQAMKNTQNGK